MSSREQHLKPHAETQAMGTVISPHATSQASHNEQHKSKIATMANDDNWTILHQTMGQSLRSLKWSNSCIMGLTRQNEQGSQSLGPQLAQNPTNRYRTESVQEPNFTHECSSMLSTQQVLIFAELHTSLPPFYYQDTINKLTTSKNTIVTTNLRNTYTT